jgi:D-glycero-D-manno-heptose 1,7-bisphosphate phosphatase
MRAGAWPRKVVILDRDGTLVVDRGYLDDPAGLTFLPGAAAGLRFMREQGYRLVVITNQSGVGRGLFPVSRLHAIHDRLKEMVRDAGATLDGIYFCPHLPDAGCACRKPAGGLMMQAAAELGFELSSVVVIGDKASDIEFGQRLGAPAILVAGPESLHGPRGEPDVVVADLLQAAHFIHRNNTVPDHAID